MTDVPQSPVAAAPVAPHQQPTKGPRVLLRALRSRNYRLFFGGQGLSLIGTWMQNVALSWMVYTLAKPSFMGLAPVFWLGVVGFSGQILTFVVAPFAGVMADSWDRKRMLVLTQTLSMVQALLLAAVAYAASPHMGGAALVPTAVSIWSVIGLGALLGFINGFDIPIRQSFVVEMVERREDLPNAIAMNSTLFNSARLIGPAIAGGLLYMTTPAVCFLLNAVSYGAVIAALLAMRIAPRVHHHRPQRVLHSLKEGFRYAFGFPPIRALLMLLALVSLLGMPYATLLPRFADMLRHDDPGTFGFLVSAAGAGALSGALFLASRKSVLGLGRWIAVAPTIFGLGLIAFALSHWLWLSLPLLVLVGFGVMVQMASTNTILQTIVDDDKRGRVMSFHTMAFMGTAPFGALLAGGLANAIGPTFTLLVGAAACIVGSMAFLAWLPVMRKMIRPIYVEKGIINGPT